MHSSIKSVWIQTSGRWDNKASAFRDITKRRFKKDLTMYLNKGDEREKDILYFDGGPPVLNFFMLKVF